MQRKTKQPLAFLAIMVLFMQMLFGSLSAMAIDENNTISPIVTQIPTTSADSAAITQQATTADSAVIYVDATKGNGGDGTEWANAYNDLQRALDDAKAKLLANNHQQLEIWLAQGTYTPTKEVGATGARYATFQMQNNVAIYGGFNGTETTVTERDWKNHKTMLSGDIDNTPTDNTGNAYHVFYHPSSLNLNHTAILDGVTITGGNANSSGGGGMYNDSSSPTLTNVTYSFCIC